MRSAVRSILVLAFLAAGLTSSGQPLPDDQPPEGIPKRKRHPFVVFLSHRSWPEEAAIQAKRVEGALVTSETSEMLDRVKAVLRPKYCPASQAQSQVIACADFRDDNDYLLLRYSPSAKASVAIEIQDAHSMYVSIGQENFHQSDLSRVADLVTSVALEFLNPLFVNDRAATECHVIVSEIALDNAKCGTFVYGSDPRPLGSWDSSIGWWTDGTKVLFEIPRGRLWDSQARHASQPLDPDSPRRFYYRRSDAVQAEVRR